MKLRYNKPKIFPLWARFKQSSQGKNYYILKNEGISLSCEAENLPYVNHIEMAGFEISSIISYKIDCNKKLRLYRFCVFPQIRVIPNETRGSLSYSFDSVAFNLPVKTEKVEFDGTLTFLQNADGIDIIHKISPAYNKKALLEKIIVKNTGCKQKSFFIKNKKTIDRIKKSYLVDDRAQEIFTTAFDGDNCILDKKYKVILNPDEERTILICSGAERLNAQQIEEQFALRHQFIEQIKSLLEINTPDSKINRMVSFCKIRAAESIFNTKNGLMHSPGGGNYYGALWTNDQCEYANPLFAYLGYSAAKEQSVNCYSLFSEFAKENKAIPTSIIACGTDIWNGAGDRGDNSMFLYGISRYLLSTGDRKKALEFLPYIKTAVEFVKSNITDSGIVKSDSDELENRFESGNANLSTACITYDAFVSLNYLYNELGEREAAEQMLELAEKIKNGIEKYFGADVEGYKTYRYCKEEKNLRSWICLPLTVGIDNRKEETVNALLSDRISKNNGMLTRSGEKTYWDRSLLYALRGLFYVGKSDEAYNLLINYTEERLLGFHPPYPIEAFPEGNSAQLSAESALYVRIFTEGILGYRPIGFYSFEIKPNLPKSWNFFEIKNMELCGKIVNISIRNEKNYIVRINDKEIELDKGEKYICRLQ